MLPLILQKKNGLFITSDEEEGDGLGGDDTDMDEVSTERPRSLG
jgi:hypothetical protein